MIKNVILDMGNVLLDYNPEVSLNKFCSSEAEKEIIRKELFCGEEWIWGDSGKIKNVELFDLVKKHVPEENWTALKNCCEQWDICMVPISGAKDFCEELKAKGFGIFVLSNASDLFYKYFERLLPLDFFDGIVVSSDIKIIKPARECYEYILKKYNLRAGECLFVDDRAQNVDAAKSVGMCGFQFTGDFDAVRKVILNFQGV